MKLVIEIDDVRYKDIQRIASVQLENYHFKTAEQIIANGTPLPSVEPEKCGDCINREELNKKLNYLCECLCEYSKKQREFMCKACKLGAVIDAVEEMPSVEPERKTEVKNPVMPHCYWIHDEDWECSVCHSHISESKFMANDYGTPIYNYCPICGADLTGV